VPGQNEMINFYSYLPQLISLFKAKKAINFGQLTSFCISDKKSIFGKAKKTIFGLSLSHGI
jgi:hypothetical protein